MRHLFTPLYLTALICQLSLATKSYALVNGSFEAGLTGWTSSAGVQISPFPDLPASDGTNCVHLGLNNLPGAVLSQNLPVVPGSSNLLLFDLFALIDNRLATVTVVRVELVAPSGILTSQTFTNTGRNTPPITYQTLSVPFTVPAGVSTLTLRFVDLTPNSGIAADPILDNVRILAQTPSFPSVLTGPITNSANGHKYYLLEGTNWTASQAQAVALGGNLVTINDAAEQAWVYATFNFLGDIRRALWIGLSDYAHEGNFVWASGQTIPYSNWVPGEPNNFDGKEHYVHMFPAGDHLGRSSRWNDYDDFTHVVYDTYSVSLHGVVEIDDVANPPTECAEQVAWLNAQLAAANMSNATLRLQLSLLSRSNAVLRAQIDNLQSANTTWRSQLASANNNITHLQRQLAAANHTTADLQSRLATAQTANAALRTQLRSATTKNQDLQNRLGAIANSMVRLEDFFADQYNDPTFRISGSTTELQVSNLVSAIEDLNSTQQRALMKILSPAKVKTRK